MIYTLTINLCTRYDAIFYDLDIEDCDRYVDTSRNTELRIKGSFRAYMLNQKLQKQERGLWL